MITLNNYNESTKAKETHRCGACGYKDVPNVADVAITFIRDRQSTVIDLCEEQETELRELLNGRAALRKLEAEKHG